MYDSGENDLATGSGFNHHQIPLRRYGGGYTATGHSLLFLLFTLYSLLFTLDSFHPSASQFLVSVLSPRVDPASGDRALFLETLYRF